MSTKSCYTNKYVLNCDIYICRYRTLYAFTYAISLYKEMQNLM